MVEPQPRGEPPAAHRPQEDLGAGSGVEDGDGDLERDAEEANGGAGDGEEDVEDGRRGEQQQDRREEEGADDVLLHRVVEAVEPQPEGIPLLAPAVETR